MKKVSILLLCLVLTFGCLTACSRNKDKNNATDNNNNNQNNGVTQNDGNMQNNGNMQTPADDVIDGTEDVVDGLADGVRGLWHGLTGIFEPNAMPRTVEGNEEAYRAYGLSDDLIEDYILQSPENGDTAHEFFIAKVREGKMAEVEQILEQRKEAIASNWAERTESNYDYARQPVIYKSGNYIMLAVHESAEDIRTEFERLVGEMEKK